MVTAMAVAAGLLAGAGPASAGSKREPVVLTDAVASCASRGFDVLISAVRNKEYQTATPLPDGSTLLHITGSLVSRLTNVTTGKAITVNTSGPAKLTFHPDGSFEVDGTGAGLLPLGAAAAPFGLPELALTKGHLQISFGPSGEVKSLSMRGNVTDLCAALA
jgi:hypothetical protein